MVLRPLIFLFLMNFYETDCIQCGLKVMHGQTPIYNSPWFVHMEVERIDGFKSQCSGVLISPSIILSDAHCLSLAKINGWYAYAGMSDWSLVDGQRRQIVRHAIHPKFMFDKSFDMSIIVTDHPFNLNFNLNTIGFPRSINLEPYDLLKECQLTGSGKTIEDYKCVTSIYKRSFPGILIGLSCCSELKRLGMITEEYPNKTSCFYSNLDQACKGDSGGGVTCRDPETNRPILVALTRAGNPCWDESGNQSSGPLPINVVPMDLEHRTWISLMAYNHFHKLYPFNNLELQDTSRPSAKRSAINSVDTAKNPAGAVESFENAVKSPKTAVDTAKNPAGAVESFENAVKSPKTAVDTAKNPAGAVESFENAVKSPKTAVDTSKNPAGAVESFENAVKSPKTAVDTAKNSDATSKYPL